MRARAVAPDNRRMPRVRIRVALKLEPGIEPITGILRPPVGDPQPFTGCLSSLSFSKPSEH
jgi:hypothetical protein